MGFSPAVKAAALAACGRHCCICHKFCGTKIECHHIVHEAEGGVDAFENCHSRVLRLSLGYAVVRFQASQGFQVHP